jgi:uncharacterized protein (DUF1684 family)
MLITRYILLCLSALITTIATVAQDNLYLDSMKAYRQHYVEEHEVVKGVDKNYFRFYDADPAFRVTATLERINDLKGFDMLTSSGIKRKYYKYGLLTFSIKDTAQQLYVYQSADLMKQEKYKDYLFVPFGDATSGIESYGGGRYLEFYFEHIVDCKVILDFNKTYNPYCMYANGYNCPIPPIENLLTVAIEAGEKIYAKPLH